MGNSTSHSPNYPGRLVCAPRLWTKNNSFHLERALNIAAMQPCPPEFLVTNCACAVQQRGSSEQEAVAQRCLNVPTCTHYPGQLLNINISHSRSESTE